MAGALVMVVACGGGSTHQPRRSIAELLAAADADAAIAELEFVVASNPRDLAAHVALAQIYLRVERGGAALRHFAIAERNGGLDAAGRHQLAALYHRRGQLRIELGHGDAHRDFALALRLHDALQVSPGERSQALFLAALAEFRHGDRVAARSWLEATTKLGSDPRTALLDLDAADLDDLGVAANWLFAGGAMRVALAVLERYLERGGSDPAVLSSWLAARSWWGGVAARPDILTLDGLAARGIDLCEVARSPAELGCGRTLVAIAESDSARAEELRQLAARRYWRTSNADQAAAWTLIGLRAWLDAEVDSWFAAVSARVDIDELLARYRSEELPGFARATLLRAAGRSGEARAALLEVVAAAAALSAEQRAVVIAEAAMQELGVDVLDSLAGLGPVSASAGRVLLRDARRRGDWVRERALLERMPKSVAAAYLGAGHDLEPALAAGGVGDGATRTRQLHTLWRWRRACTAYGLRAGHDEVTSRWRALGFAEVAAPRGLVGFGIANPYAVVTELGAATMPAALSDIARAYVREPAAADRLAEEFVAGVVAIGVRGPVVAELFDRLGDPARALEWWDRVARSSPRHPPYLYSSAVAAVAAGDYPRADTLFISAAAASGDGGAVNRAAARAYARVGADVEALIAGRRALQLTAPGEELELLATIASVNESLGRKSDAEATRRYLLDRIAPDYRDAATGGWSSRRDHLLGDPASAGSFPADPGLAVARARELIASGDKAAAVAALTSAAGWNPGAVAVRRALLAQLEPTAPDYQRVAAELLLIGLSGDRRSAALEAMARVFVELEQPAASMAVAAELRALRFGEVTGLKRCVVKPCERSVSTGAGEWSR